MTGSAHNLPRVIQIALKITLCDPSRNRVEGVAKDGVLITLSVTAIGPMFIWPQVGEYWMIRRENYDWVLGTRIQNPNDKNPAVSDISPGQGYIHASDVTLSNNHILVHTDPVHLATGDTLVWHGTLGAGESDPAIPSGNWVAEPGSSTRTGVVDTFAGTTAPLGALMCDGALYSRTTYAKLFSVIGTTYGAGDGTTTFGVPNIPAGTNPVQQGGGFTLGTTGGEATHTLSTAEMPSHNHGGATGSGSSSSGNASISDPGHSHTSAGLQAGANGVAAGNGWGGSFISTTPSATGVFDSGHSHSVPSMSIGADGGGTAHNNMQPWIAMNFIIWA